MTSILIQLPCVILWSCGFCVIFNVPIRKFPACILVGTLSWMSYQAFIYSGISQVLAIFLSSCIVWLLSNICARIVKEPSTLFIIPGIIGFVPGAGLYYTMLGILGHDAGTSLTSIATKTMLTAGAIAAGLLVMGSLTGVFILLTKKR